MLAPRDRHRDPAGERRARSRRRGRRRRQPRRRAPPRRAARARDPVPVRASWTSTCSQLAVDRGRARARAVHRAAGRRHDRAGDGADACGSRWSASRSLDLIAYPLRHTSPDRRAGGRRPPPRGVLRLLPAGARRRAAHHGVRGRARPTALAGELAARGEDALLAGDGALRYRDRARRARPRRAGRARARRCRARPRSSSWRPRATSARSSARRPRCIRCTFAAATPRSSGSGGVSSGDRATAASRSSVHIVPMRRRHLRSVLGIETQVYPRPWTMSLFLSELGLRAHPRVLRGQGRPRRRRLRGPDGDRSTRATSRRSRSTPRGTATRSGRACCSRSSHEAIAREAQRAHARGAGQQHRRAGDVPQFGFSVGRRAQGLLRRDERGRARDVGAPHRHARSTRRGSTRSSDGIDGETVVRAGPALVERVTAILGIETSCDETAAAVVDDGHDIRSSVVSSQVDLHARFGGVVPEIASRAHAELVSGVDRGGAGRGGRRASTTSTRSPRATGPGSRARCSSA